MFIKTDLAISSRFMYEQARNLVSDKRYDLLYIHQPHHLFYDHADSGGGGFKSIPFHEDKCKNFVSETSPSNS